MFQLFWNNGYEAYTAEAAPNRVPREKVEAWWAKHRTDGGTFNYLFAEPDEVADIIAS